MRIPSIALCLAISLAAGSSVAFWGWTARAQDQACRYYKVQAGSLNISKEPRGDAVFIDVLDSGEVVCVTRTEKAGDRDWVYIAQKYPKPNEHVAVEGWTNPRLLQEMSPAEAAAATGAPPPAPAPAAAAAPADDTLRFTQPIPEGPFPVQGQSIEQLARGIPQFPPIEGLPEEVWKKSCQSCHQWDRQALCEQGASYAKNPRSALRHPHPYGGAYKAALMRWAKSGCQ
ncbi:hypothetical protein QMZ05_17515 [Bradyrhizobium sp. INPA03-11B]|uniref:hypothetical protein n=1 Tax=Bradyrhizobium sp. INPA03-11B TaxID=418598 RepID=UPI00338DF6CC